MSATVQTGATLPFDQFWRWLQGHENCILWAGTPDCYVYDQDDFHWHLTRDEEQNPVIEVLWGKRLVAEFVLDTRDVLFVQATPDVEGGEPDRFLFELIGGDMNNPEPVYRFLLAHGLEEGGSGERGTLVH